MTTNEDTRRYGSVSLPEDSQLSPELLEELEKLPPLNIHRLLTWVPECRKPWIAMVSSIYQTGFDSRLREIAICRYGFKTDCKYELHQHKALARNAGIKEDELNIILSEPIVTSLGEEENLVCKAVDEFEDLAGVSDETMKNLLEKFGIRTTMILLFILGHYTCVTRVLNSARIPLEPVSPLANCASPMGQKD